MNIKFHFNIFDEYYVPALERIHILSYCEDDKEIDNYWIYITEDLFDKIQFSKAGLNWLCNVIWVDAWSVSKIGLKT
jgi:hypothetical protein